MGAFEGSIFTDMSSLQHTTFDLRGEFITLDHLLKATGLAPSGGVAKLMIADGMVQVDGHEELRKTAKIRAGQQVRFQDTLIQVVAGSEDDEQKHGDDAA